MRVLPCWPVASAAAIVLCCAGAGCSHRSGASVCHPSGTMDPTESGRTARDWVYVLKSTGWVDVKGFEVDKSGNSYIAGAFRDSLVAGKNTHISEGDTDIYVAKVSPTANLLWLKTYGGFKADYTCDISLNVDSSSGEIRWIGYTSGVGYSLTRVNGAGRVVWRVPVNALGACAPLAVDKSGTSYLFGAGVPADGSHPILALKVDRLGRRIWSKVVVRQQDLQEGTLSVENVAPHRTGGIVATGTYGGTVRIGNEVLATNDRLDEDVVVLRMNASGDIMWAATARGHAGTDESSAVSVGKSGRIYITGFTVGRLVFDSRTVLNATPDPIKWQDWRAARRDWIDWNDSRWSIDLKMLRRAFVASLNSNGSWVWARTLPARWGRTVAVDRMGDVHVGGEANEALTPSGVQAPPRKYKDVLEVPWSDVFLAKLDGSGWMRWTSVTGGEGPQSAYKICAGGSGSLWIAGTTRGQRDSRLGGHTLRSRGVFVWRRQPHPGL